MNKVTDGREKQTSRVKRIMLFAEVLLHKSWPSIHWVSTYYHT